MKAIAAPKIGVVSEKRKRLVSRLESSMRTPDQTSGIENIEAGAPYSE
jgi:hypothetical protein